MFLSNSCCYSYQANFYFKDTNEDAHGHKNINFKSILAKGIYEIFIIENKYTMNSRSIEFNFNFGIVTTWNHLKEMDGQNVKNI